MLLKALAIGLLLALGEKINGNIRVRVLHRLYGQRRAKTLSLLRHRHYFCYNLVSPAMGCPYKLPRLFKARLSVANDNA
ncbi:hypothetical protein [Pseudoalteromonas tetraodonis]|uniref:hypothetical protein n=1 Tax=Pseudoalteromonas tetraodonis TaxID=43659 RepID=UPI003734D935